MENGERCISHFNSTKSLDFTGQESVSGFLSRAMVSALSLPTDSIETSPPQFIHTSVCLHAMRKDIICPTVKADELLASTLTSAAEPIDFEWLSVRCDRDDQLFLQVLESFFQQGQEHLSAMQKAAQDEDADRILFHTVCCP